MRRVKERIGGFASVSAGFGRVGRIQTGNPGSDAVGAETVAVDRRQAVLVNEAFLAFGKGRHKARLNYGDCFSYALAKSLDLPLLFKGDDFRHTDVRPAL